MKMNKKNMHMAIVHMFFELYSVRDLADRVVDDLDDEDVGSVELHSSKQSGFTIRCKKDTEIENETVVDAIAEAMSDMLDDRDDEAMDFMSDNYEQGFDSDQVNNDLVRETFDISHNGRLIIIEIDM